MEKQRTEKAVETDPNSSRNVDPTVSEICDLVRKHLSVTDSIVRLTAQVIELESFEEKGSIPFDRFYRILSGLMMLRCASEIFSDDFSNFIEAGHIAMGKDAAFLAAFRVLITGAGTEARKKPKSE